MQPLTKLYILPLLILIIMFICTPVCAENVTVTGTTVYTTLPTPAPGITTARPTIAPVITIIPLDYLNYVVYFGETVDLTKVISWSGKFAWWADGEYKAVPEEIVDVSTQGFYERYRISGTPWRVGKWYKWDGAYEPAGNNFAFEIKLGVRPVPTPIEKNWTSLRVPTPTPTPSWSWKNITSDIIIVRGDDLKYDYSVGENVDWYKDGYLWLFGESEASASPPIMGNPLDKSALNQSMYKYYFTQDITEQLVPGVYKGYMQFIGNNSRKDIFYTKENDEFDTPYKDIKAVPLRGFIPIRMRQELEQLMKNKEYCDDIFIPITIQIKNPIITFTEYYEMDDNLIIEGTSPMSAGTPISFIIDPEQWVKQSEISENTWYTNLTGDINKNRVFRIALPVKWDELGIGYNHTIVGTIKKNNIVVSQNKDFRVSSINVNPLPTPSRLKVLVESYGWHTVNNTNYTYAQLSNGTTLNIPVPTPEQVIVYVKQTVIQIVTVMVTPSQTPTQEADVPALIGISALVVCAYIVIRKR